MSENPKRLIGTREVAEKLHIGRTKAYELIRELNREYRGIDRATDVLSFPFLDFETPDVTVLLGDIVISRDTAYRQAEEYGHSPKREFCFLAAHSALHLLGYDHLDEGEEKAKMRAREKAIMKELGYDF